MGGRKTIPCCFAEPKFPSVVLVTRTKSAAAQGDVGTGMGRGQGGARDTAVTPSTAFTLCKRSEEDTCVKNSLRVKVQYSVFELVNKALL